MKFSKKTAHRLIVSLSMFAPVLYLFGAMFFGLAGAHGEKIYEDEIIIEQTPSYDDLMTPENFRYDAFDWETSKGTRFGFSLGYLAINEWNSSQMLYSYRYGVDIYVDANGDVNTLDNFGLGWAGADEDGEEYIGFDFGLGVYGIDDVQTEEVSGIYSLVYSPYGSNEVALELAFSDGTSEVWYFDGDDWFKQSPPFSSFQWESAPNILYFDDGSHMPSKAISNLPAGFEELLIPSVKPVEVSSSTYTASIFGQFFPHDNFLERVGVNALSSDPVGFAPFGAFLSYLDTNMLHGSQSQMALMIYGEVYWALHIVLADLVYHVAVFFPNLIERVFDWFGQKGLNDD